MVGAGNGRDWQRQGWGWETEEEQQQPAWMAVPSSKVICFEEEPFCDESEQILYYLSGGNPIPLDKSGLSPFQNSKL